MSLELIGWNCKTEVVRGIISLKLGLHKAHTSEIEEVILNDQMEEASKIKLPRRKGSSPLTAYERYRDVDTGQRFSRWTSPAVDLHAEFYFAEKELLATGPNLGFLVLVGAPLGTTAWPPCGRGGHSGKRNVSGNDSVSCADHSL